MKQITYLFEFFIVIIIFFISRLIPINQVSLIGGKIFEKFGPLSKSHQTAISTMVSIMGRISAYSGKEVTWEELMQSDLRLGPETYAMGKVAIPTSVPVAGQSKTS